MTVTDLRSLGHVTADLATFQTATPPRRRQAKHGMICGSALRYLAGGRPFWVGCFGVFQAKGVPTAREGQDGAGSLTSGVAAGAVIPHWTGEWQGRHPRVCGWGGPADRRWQTMTAWPCTCHSARALNCRCYWRGWCANWLFQVP